ncbi:MAG: hypothetical protein BMS9Abin13_372 [Patescibacteria group bacterium]|nr:MAG: hypothetical protein BMS9Abin13_372 [Patescibacteria group bacterium]
MEKQIFQNTKQGISKAQIVNSFAASAIAAIGVIVLLVIAGELYKPLKSFLANAFVHHWIGKGVLAFFTFAGLGIALVFFDSSGENTQTKILLSFLVWVAVLGTVSIIVFFAYEAFFAQH